MLDLSHNKLEALDWISPNLRELSLTANQISLVKVPKSESLIHLSLSYNPIDDHQLVNIVKCFPKLFSLDLAWTNVQGLQNAVDCLKVLPDLRMVSFNGAPVSLCKNYRAILKQNF